MLVNTFAYGLCVGCDKACPVNVLVVGSDIRIGFFSHFFIIETTSRGESISDFVAFCRESRSRFVSTSMDNDTQSSLLHLRFLKITANCTFIIIFDRGVAQHCCATLN